jgi:hypothetical protein
VTFTVYVDEPRWRAHQRRVLAELPGLVPVAKGNGYGVGNDRLAEESARLGVGALAVGIDQEVDEVLDRFPGDVLVLTPVMPPYDGAPTRPTRPTTLTRPTGGDRASRVLRTVSHLEALGSLPSGTRVVVECRTSMNRHGLRPPELASVPAATEHVTLEGFALHLPLERAGGNDPVRETSAWLGHVAAAGLPTSTLWVSHLDPRELAELSQRYPATTFRPRIGTRLWLGDRTALTARGTVLDVEPLERGERSGYRQHRATARGHLLVVSGGTAHGVALEAPKAVRGAVARAKVVALGALEAAGHNLSPFTWHGKQRWFVEPPHMQVSLVFLPHDVAPPAIGDELDCAVRLTTTHPDRVLRLP